MSSLTWNLMCSLQIEHQKTTRKKDVVLEIGFLPKAVVKDAGRKQHLFWRPKKCRSFAKATFVPGDWWKHRLPPPKVQHSPWKNDGWKTAFLLGRELFRGELLNFGRVHFKCLCFGFGAKDPYKTYRFRWIDYCSRCKTCLTCIHS